MNNKYKIYTLGCKVNQYDSASLGAKLKRLGLELVNKNADWVIVNTCAVTKTAIRKGRQTIVKAKKENPGAKIILMGCWPKAYPEKKEEMKADYIFKVGDANKVINLIKEYLKDIKIFSVELDTVASTDRSRYFVKIQDGCEQFCAYCIIPYTRGKLKSRNEKEIITEIELAIKNGFREIILSGIHLGLFGKDKGKVRLVPLIKEILKIKNLGRIRLSSIEVTEISDDLIDLIASNDRMCKHLHIPLQSGTDKILKAMNRPYDTKYFFEKVKKIRKKIPNIAITNDVIVGFPGETNSDFEETYKFIKKVKFSKLHVFSFSAHEKTPAVKMTNQVNPKEIKNRSEALRQLDTELQNRYQSKFKNKILDVVVGGRSGKKLNGKTEFFFDVDFDRSQIISEVKEGESLVKRIVVIK